MKKIWIPLALMLLLVVAATAQAHPRHDGPRAPRGDGWQTFSERFDANADGQVSADEYDGRLSFKFLDFNEDGVLTEADFDARQMERHTKMLTFITLMRADEDRDGAVSSADYSAFLAQLDANGDGTLERDELGELRRHPRGERGERGGRGGEGMDAPERPEISIAVSDLEAAFAKLDANGDGVVERDELPQRRHRGGEGHGPRRGPRGR